MDSNDTTTELLAESAACEALGANSPAESAAYQRQLAADATGKLRELDRQLRETAGRLGAASPHMKPPAELRGRILQATAPVTFKMEDYRKATREDYRFYKWGFYAAALFLIMGAMYNIDARGRLDQANKNIMALEQREQQLARQSSDIITTFARGNTITWKDANGQAYGKAIVDMNTHKAVLVFPQETMPPGARPQLKLTLNNEQVAFDTTLVTARAAELGYVVPPNAPDIAQIMNVRNLKPDESTKPQTADMLGGR